jgi:hypothetical protein
VDWVNLAQDTVKWRAFVNTVMNLLIQVYVLVRYYVVSLVNRFSTFRDSIVVSSSSFETSKKKILTLEDEATMFFEQVIQ